MILRIWRDNKLCYMMKILHRIASKKMDLLYDAGLENLAFASYLSLEEIQNFDWDKEVYYFEQDCRHSEITCELYTETIPYMLSVDTNYQNVRIVFGLSL